MTAPTGPTATRAHAELDPRALDGAASVSKRNGTVRRLVFKILATLGVGARSDRRCGLPSAGERLPALEARGFDYARLRWMYERIHYDPRPIDVVILGSSRAQVGLSAAAIEQQLAEHGKTQMS